MRLHYTMTRQRLVISRTSRVRHIVCEALGRGVRNSPDTEVCSCHLFLFCVSHFARVDMLHYLLGRCKPRFASCSFLACGPTKQMSCEMTHLINKQTLPRNRDGNDEKW